MAGLHDTQPIPTGTPPSAGMADYTLAELRQLEATVQAAIERQRETARATALNRIAQLVNDAELTVDDVVERLTAKPVKKRRKLSPKYRDPDHPEKTWAGRGKRPIWLNEKLAAGFQLDDFLIRQPETAQ